MPPKCPNSVAPNGNTQKSGSSGYFSCVSEDPQQKDGKAHYTLCAANTSKTETRFDFQLEDQRIRDSAIGHLKLAATRLSSEDKTVLGAKGFFIGCGFRKALGPLTFTPKSGPAAARLPAAALAPTCDHPDVSVHAARQISPTSHLCFLLNFWTTFQVSSKRFPWPMTRMPQSECRMRRECDRRVLLPKWH
jgi:hypothetical protein